MEKFIKYSWYCTCFSPLVLLLLRLGLMLVVALPWTLRDNFNSQPNQILNLNMRNKKFFFMTPLSLFIENSYCSLICINNSSITGILPFGPIWLKVWNLHHCIQAGPPPPSPPSPPSPAVRTILQNVSFQ